MKLIKNKITLEELQEIANEIFGDMVKAVVDIEKEIMIIGGELHSDEESIMLSEHGSKQKNLWGINLYPANQEGFLEFDSIINIRPSLNNRSRDVKDPEIRKKIVDIINKLTEKK
ncbi:MAG: hypothetical protein A3F40_04640 [Chlamydiae bacterium RIFCSPHIGHO2_12_FULL_27_8]|nr:MAG: hypothetical protein A3F40_04640 [Chlamydiae bacterium RIFCSPHIGHO2_12_FULL_27_8]OGN65555.1 MAG: hypothetical protein A2888_01840 [Chlamydiae bacterium RIFCSPLOWO2_01_FULL_28_7]